MLVTSTSGGPPVIDLSLLADDPSFHSHPSWEQYSLDESELRKTTRIKNVTEVELSD